MDGKRRTVYIHLFKRQMGEGTFICVDTLIIAFIDVSEDIYTEICQSKA